MKRGKFIEISPGLFIPVYSINSVELKLGSDYGSSKSFIYISYGDKTVALSFDSEKDAESCLRKVIS